MLKRALVAAVLVGAICFLSMPSLASPSGGPDPMVEGRQWAAAAELDFISERKLESSEASSAEYKEALTAYAKVSFQPSELLTLYGKAGIANLETDLILTDGNNIKEKFNTGFYTGGGGRIILDLGAGFSVIADNQFSWQTNEIEDVEYNGVSATNKDSEMTLWEYQLAGLLCYKINWDKLVHPIHGEYPALTPYVGAKYAYLEMDADVRASGPGFSITSAGMRKNEDTFGLILGLGIDFYTLGGFAFNIEYRHLDEDAISGYLNYTF